jgi:anti-sigma regulatory factor (Ser/Thr protein kinase)
VQASEAVALRWSARSASQARDLLDAALTGFGLDAAVIADVLLVASELVSNALRHARPMADGGLRLAWRLDDGGLRIEVTDGGSDQQPHVQQLTDSGLGGRGLAMVEALTARWGTAGSPDGCLVWCVVPVSP